VGKTFRTIVLDIVVACIIFGAGYACSTMQRGNELQHYRTEYAEAITDLRQAREAQSAAIARLNNIQGQLGASQATVRKLQERIAADEKRIAELIGTVDAITNRLSDSQAAAIESAGLIEEFRGILREVQGMGGK
jgi:chromosome segregation ATPase